MSRTTIFDHTALEDDDRSFEEQMSDLNVEVVKPKETETKWYKATPRNNKAGLGERISLSNTCITIGREAIKTFGGPGSKLKIGIKEIKNTKVITIAHSENGLWISKTKSNSYRVGTKALVKWLKEEGAKRGVYRLKEVKGGWLAVPEGGGAGGR